MQRGVTNLVGHPPTLEELFLRHYASVTGLRILVRLALGATG